MFTPEDREELRDELVSAAEADARISAAALVGSSGLGTEDQWSDIDLALCVEATADRSAVVAEWTGMMYGSHGAVHHVDVIQSGTVYRVFLLADTLQVDLSFWPAAEFRSTGPGFHQLFGPPAKQVSPPAGATAELIGMAWLYALHARSSVARARVWQAEYMISGVRDHVLALACRRHDLPAGHGRGFDRLPRAATMPIEPAIVRSLEIAELRRAFLAITEALIGEVDLDDPELAARLAAPLRELAS